MEDEQLLGEILFSGARNYSVKLLSMVDRLLDDNGCSVKHLDLVAVSAGPGSFTGLRVGISTAQGLALAENKNLIGIATLEVIAYQAFGHHEQICPMIASRGQEIFTALYRFTETGVLEQRVAATACEPESWLAGIHEQTVFLGSGAWRYQQQIKDYLKDAACVLSLYAGIPKASTVAHLARTRSLNQTRNDLFTIVPVYVKESDAERYPHRRKGSFQPITGYEPAEHNGTHKMNQ